MVMSLFTLASRIALTIAFIDSVYPVTAEKKEVGNPRQDMTASWPMKWSFKLSAEKILASTTWRKRKGETYFKCSLLCKSLFIGLRLFNYYMNLLVYNKVSTPLDIESTNKTVVVNDRKDALVRKNNNFVKLPWDCHAARWALLGSGPQQWLSGPVAELVGLSVVQSVPWLPAQRPSSSLNERLTGSTLSAHSSMAVGWFPVL